MDENNVFDDEDIVVLKSNTGEEIKFVEIAGIAYGAKFYAILKPVDEIEDLEDDEALVFEVNNNNGNATYKVVLDDSIIDIVFNEYYKLLDESNNN